jgi:hypothetical protein
LTKDYLLYDGNHLYVFYTEVMMMMVTQHDVIFKKLTIRKDLKKLLIKKNKSLGRSHGSIVM